MPPAIKVFLFAGSSRVYSYTFGDNNHFIKSQPIPTHAHSGVYGVRIALGLTVSEFLADSAEIFLLKALRMSKKEIIVVRICIHNHQEYTQCKMFRLFQTRSNQIDLRD